MPEPVVTEGSDVSPLRVVLGALSIWGTLFLVALAVTVLLRGWDVSPQAGPNQPLKTLPPKPVLLSAPQPDRAAYDAEKARLLTGYAWLDRRQGLARIPIDAAMTLMAAGVRADTSGKRGGQP